MCSFACRRIWALANSRLMNSSEAGSSAVCGVGFVMRTLYARQRPHSSRRLSCANNAGNLSSNRLRRRIHLLRKSSGRIHEMPGTIERQTTQLRWVEQRVRNIGIDRDIDSAGVESLDRTHIYFCHLSVVRFDLAPNFLVEVLGARQPAVSVAMRDKGCEIVCRRNDVWRGGRSGVRCGRKPRAMFDRSTLCRARWMACWLRVFVNLHAHTFHQRHFMWVLRRCRDLVFRMLQRIWWCRRRAVVSDEAGGERDQ